MIVFFNSLLNLCVLFHFFSLVYQREAQLHGSSSSMMVGNRLRVNQKTPILLYKKEPSKILSVFKSSLFLGIIDPLDNANACRFATRLTGIKENTKFQKNGGNGLEHVVDQTKQLHNMKYGLAS